MAQYLPFPNKAAAVNASRDAWTAVLGRPRNPGDTEFLYNVVTNPNDGSTLGVIESYMMPYLLGIQRNMLLQADDPAVTGTLNAIAAAFPSLAVS